MVAMIFFIFFVIIFSAQVAVVGTFELWGVVPDLALIFAVYCGIYFQKDHGVWMGFLIGLVQDCLSAGLLGVNTLSKSLIGFTFSSIKNKILVEGYLPICVFLVASSFFDGLIFYFTSLLMFKGDASMAFIFSKLPVFAFYNALIGPMMFSMLNWNKRWINRKFPNRLLRPS